jgi:O-antigen/teichoic acid export membrane protein
VNGLRRALKNVAALLVAKVGGRIGNFVVFAAVGRYLGADGLGAYAAATALAGYFMVGADLGLSTWITRSVASDPESLIQNFQRARGAKLPLTLASFVLLSLIYFLLPAPQETRLLFWLVGAACILESYAMLNDGVCRAVERMEYEGISGVIRTLVFAAGAALCVISGARVWCFGMVSIVAVIFQLAVSSHFAAKFVVSGASYHGLLGTLKQSTPYGVTSVTAVAFGQIDVVIISFIAGAEVVGRYAALSRLLLVLGIIPVLASTAMLPALTRFWSQDGAARFPGMVGRLVTVAGVAAAGAVVGLSFFGEQVISLL